MTDPARGRAHPVRLALETTVGPASAGKRPGGAPPFNG